MELPKLQEVVNEYKDLQFAKGMCEAWIYRLSKSDLCPQVSWTCLSNAPESGT